MSVRYDPKDLQQFATRLFMSAGLAEDRARVMAAVLLEADLLGFTTHGMHRVAHNVRWLLSGESRCGGEPVVLADRGALFNWDAGFLPGPWVVSQYYKAEGGDPLALADGLCPGLSLSPAACGSSAACPIFGLSYLQKEARPPGRD